MRFHKRLVCAALLALSAASQVSFASDLRDRLLDPDSLPREDIGSEGGESGLRLEMIYEAGLAAGLRSGSAETAAKIIADVENRREDFDRLYKFNYLFTGSGVFIPPVVEEARDVQSTDGRVMRIASRVYRIVKPGRLSFNAPGWEDYIFVGLDPEPAKMPSSAVLPKTEKEKEVWQKGVREGWDLGVIETNNIYEVNKARLDRDFMGIMLYGALRDAGLITNEVVAQEQTVVRGDANQMTVDEKVFQITQDPGLVTDDKRWKPILKNAGTK